MGNIIELLHEFQDMFSTNFSEMKSIIGDLAEINIPLRPDAKSVKHRPYRLNPHYKEKVKAKLDQMLETCVIEPVEESEWINPLVVHDKKTSREVRIYVGLRKLNDAYLHDPFSASFIDEVLENVGGQEMY